MEVSSQVIPESVLIANVYVGVYPLAAAAPHAISIWLGTTTVADNPGGTPGISPAVVFGVLDIVLVPKLLVA